MNANEAMQNAVNQLGVVVLEGAGKKQKGYGYENAIAEIAELVSLNDSTVVIPFANEHAYVTYNRAEDLKEKGADEESIQYAEGRYEAFEDFRENFNKWLVKQDDITILKHSVNEVLSIRDGVNLPSMETAEERLLFAMATFYLRGYEQDEQGNVTNVVVEMERFKSINHTLTYGEFSKLFEIDHMDHLK